MIQVATSGPKGDAIVDLTILILTYDRSRLLKNCLEFIRTQNESVEIVIADSSTESEKQVNRKTVEQLDEDITYLEFAHDVKPLDKVLSAIEHVDSEFACMCADDDLIVLNSVFTCAEFLAQNRDYVACHGHYLRYSLTDSDSILLEDWEYSGPSLTGDSSSKRVIELMSNYEALFYSVQATPTLRKSLEAMTTSPYNMHMELANALWLVMAGKVKRIDGIHYLRQSGDASLHERGEPHSYFAMHFASVMPDYAAMAEKLTARFQLAYPDKKESDLFRVLCYGFMIYLYRSTNFISLARLMIPNFPEKDLASIPRIRPPTFRPGIRLVLEAFLARVRSFLERNTRIAKAPIAVRSNITGRSTYISRMLNGSLTNQNREEIRKLF
jgi:glycosyltransferase domain-containing protein